MNCCIQCSKESERKSVHHFLTECKWFPFHNIFVIFHSVKCHFKISAQEEITVSVIFLDAWASLEHSIINTLRFPLCQCFRAFVNHDGTLYFLKNLTNSSQALTSKVYFIKCTKLMHLLSSARFLLKENNYARLYNRAAYKTSQSLPLWWILSQFQFS